MSELDACYFRRRYMSAAKRRKHRPIEAEKVPTEPMATKPKEIPPPAEPVIKPQPDNGDKMQLLLARLDKLEKMNLASTPVIAKAVEAPPPAQEAPAPAPMKRKTFGFKDDCLF